MIVDNILQRLFTAVAIAPCIICLILIGKKQGLLPLIKAVKTLIFVYIICYLSWSLVETILFGLINQAPAETFLFGALNGLTLSVCITIYIMLLGVGFAELFIGIFSPKKVTA